MKNCPLTKQRFEVSAADRELIERISPVFNGKKYLIPDPTLGPQARLQRRLAHRNERKLYKRKCDKTGQDIISIYSDDKPFTVYSVDAWWGDDWDPMSYGRDFDVNRSFFEQFKELQLQVPRMAALQWKTENSIYTHNVSNLKDCYLLFSSDFSRDCYYAVWNMNSQDCCDNLMIDHCQLTYESFFSDYLYNCNFCIFSNNCRDSSFLFDCQNCTNCLFCYGLRNKQYCIYNQQYTQAEYEDKKKEFPLSSRNNLQLLKKRFEELIKREAAHLHIWRKGRLVNSTGDLLTNTENCVECFEASDSKDCHYSIGYEMKDSLDCTYVHKEFGYENCECFPQPFQSAFNVNCYTGSNLLYCDHCFNDCKHCFGCIGLKHAEYCILNKQYSKEKYEELVPRIIECMKKTVCHGEVAGLSFVARSAKPVLSEISGAKRNEMSRRAPLAPQDDKPAHEPSNCIPEWGQFFPMHLSPFAYNESEACNYYPLTQQEVEHIGCTWCNEDATEHQSASASTPDDITTVDDAITHETLACKECSKHYRITKQELAFYRKKNLPIPDACFHCRHLRRLQYKRPRVLHQRSCSSCSGDIQSTYANESVEQVLCEECYLKEVY